MKLSIFTPFFYGDDFKERKPILLSYIFAKICDAHIRELKINGNDADFINPGKLSTWFFSGCFEIGRDQDRIRVKIDAAIIVHHELNDKSTTLNLSLV